MKPFFLCFWSTFQIEKVVLFLLEQQGRIASRLSHLGEEHDVLFQQPNELKVSELQESYRAVGRDLLRLLFFVEMNAIGLRKILKKFDKRFGYRFTDYYVKTRANHPYSQLQQVFKHVVIYPNSIIFYLCLSCNVVLTDVKAFFIVIMAENIACVFSENFDENESFRQCIYTLCG